MSMNKFGLNKFKPVWFMLVPEKKDFESIKTSFFR